MAKRTSKQQEKDFQNFVRDLAKLSAKYRVAIQAVGGVRFYDEDISDIVYTDDPTSGDLSYKFLDTINA
jgi:hypothetical protein